MTIVDLWGNEEQPFMTARERYGIWPTTVWPCDLSDPFTQKLKRLIGDDGGERGDVFMTAGRKGRDKGLYNMDASIFNPAVAAWALNCWAPTGCTVFDPFGGGGTRAIVSASFGHEYLGIELRPNEAEAVRRRAAAHGLEHLVTIKTGDARNAGQYYGMNKAEFLLTCPPYWNFEPYGGGPLDLSMTPTLAEFADGMADVARAAGRVVVPGGLAFWVVGLIRDKRGGLIPLHHTIAQAHERAGWQLLEEVVLHQQNNGAMQRIGNFDKGQRHLLRLHEYGLLFENQREG